MWKKLSFYHLHITQTTLSTQLMMHILRLMPNIDLHTGSHKLFSISLNHDHETSTSVLHLQHFHRLTPNDLDTWTIIALFIKSRYIHGTHTVLFRSRWQNTCSLNYYQVCFVWSFLTSTTNNSNISGSISRRYFVTFSGDTIIYCGTVIWECFRRIK